MIKVLIVEDDPMVTEINQRFLEKIEGFSLYKSVNSIEDAKEAILKGNPNLILLDIFFPQGRGIELLKWIRTNDLKSDVILITADKSMDTVEEAFRYGAIDYLIKPFVFNRFKEALLQYKNRLKNFENIEKVEQNIIDKYTLNKESNDETSDIKDIKGFSKHTYQKVLNYIKSMNNRAFSAQEIADKIGVSRITARRYLDYLERENKVILELEYGKVGRPKNKYRLND
ncbi:MAG: response regulator [Firmicutes bacterium]|nr:response regulator [Bacillota bacterium]